MAFDAQPFREFHVDLPEELVSRTTRASTPADAARAAIVHAGSSEPLASLDAEAVGRCEDLVFNRRRTTGPLAALLSLFGDRPALAGPDVRGARRRPRAIGEFILSGDPVGIADALAELLKSRAALAIIVEDLVPAMAEVGRRFEAGKMQLPFVLRSAEAMRAATAGAALNRNYVESELQPAYPGRVYYAKDALEGLRIMQAIVGQDRSQVQDIKKPNEASGREVKPGIAKRRAVAVTGAVWNQPRVVGGYARAQTKILQVEIRRYAPLLDRNTLFRKRWRMLGPKPTRAARLEAEWTLDAMLAAAHRRGLWHGALVYGLYMAYVDGREVAIVHPGTGQELTRLRFAPGFARRLARQHRSSRFHVALQVVTAGGRAVEEGRRLAEQGQVREQFLLHVLGAELTEVLAGFCQSRLPKLPGWRKTARYSPGYRVWPDPSEQRKIFTLVRPERIGVTLTESFQMVPEYSGSAIVLPLPR